MYTRTFSRLLSFSLICLILFLSISHLSADDSIPLIDSAVTTDSDVEVEIEEPLVYLLAIDGAIGAVTDMRIADAIKKADDDNAELLVIMLDTPGGFVAATWTICKNILNSPVPVCMYIAPDGARAGSAGVYMTYAAHFAAMARSTNIGAAHPVSGGGEVPDSVMNEKITNDAVAQIQAAAERRGRNTEWAEKAVRESVSITYTEALELGVIDFVAVDLDDLLKQLDGQEVDLQSEKRKLALANARVERIKTTFAYRFLQVITDPNIVFILFSIGGLGIVIELYNPGSILPGVVGAISLIIAFYASSVLPINYAGVALILLAIIMFILEVKVPSFGMLTIGGVVSLFLGGVMLIDTVDPALQVSRTLLTTVVLVVGAIVGLAVWLVVRAARSRPFIGREGLIGKVAEVRSGGMVYVDGALWKANDIGGFTPGTEVEILGIDKLTLKVRKTDR